MCSLILLESIKDHVDVSSCQRKEKQTTHPEVLKEFFNNSLHSSSLGNYLKYKNRFLDFHDKRDNVTQ
jgi:hypothetical protein